jgi:NAD(P)-dependent dehydrogenase (short-subunit alcohol dehydrogenase family)
MSNILIVTGASRGIGAATARLAATRGYDVCVNYVSRATDAADVVSDIEQSGCKAIAVQADISLAADVKRLFDTTESQLGKVTALVNNAGMLETQMRLEAMTDERLTRVLMINVLGTLLCSREAVRRMSTKNGGVGGSIVNVSSMAARLGAPNEYVDYATAKGAIDTLTIGLAKEVAGEGIRVNAVRPGLIHTEMHASGGDPGRIERLKSFIPLQRGGQPEEVAAAILWLLSTEASYATGTFIDVSGGR